MNGDVPVSESNLDDKMNYGMALLNDAPCGPEATIVATGLGRSGTTMLARIMEEAGLEMGKKLTTSTREIKRLQSFIKTKERLTFKSFCKKQSRLTPKWGFKLPSFRYVMREYESSIFSPRFVVIFRDILSISLRRNISQGDELLPAMRFAIQDYLRLLEQVQKVKSPVLLISYEKSLQYPERTVAAMLDFMGISLTEERIAEIAKSAVHNANPDYLLLRSSSKEAPDGKSEN